MTISTAVDHDIPLNVLVAHWARYCGPAIAAVSWPVLVHQGGCLAIEIASQIFAAPLVKREAELLAQLPRVDGNGISSVRWTYHGKHAVESDGCR